MTYILDLRKKINPQVQIVEKVIFQKQPWYIETLKVFLAILIVSSAVWGISKADDLISDRPVSSKPFSVMGIVSSLSETSLSLHVSASDKETDYVFDTAPITTIQTSEYVNIALQDIKVGDKIIVQGRESDGIPQPTRIISFSSVVTPTTSTSTPETLVSVSTTTATTTIETASSSTPEVATTSEEIISTSTPVATTSEEVASSTPSVVETIINTVQEVIQNIVETFTGSSTPPVEEVAPIPEVPTPPVETPVDTSDASAPALTS